MTKWKTVFAEIMQIMHNNWRILLTLNKMQKLYLYFGKQLLIVVKWCIISSELQCFCLSVNQSFYFRHWPGRQNKRVTFSSLNINIIYTAQNLTRVEQIIKSYNTRKNCKFHFKTLGNKNSCRRVSYNLYNAIIWLFRTTE